MNCLNNWALISALIVFSLVINLHFQIFSNNFLTEYRSRSWILSTHSYLWASFLKLRLEFIKVHVDIYLCRIISLLLIGSLGSAESHPGAFWHLWGVNSSPWEAVWLSITLDLPRLQTQHSPNHSASQMAAPPGASNHAFQLPPRSGQAIAQLSARSDRRGTAECGGAENSSIPTWNCWNSGHQCKRF